MFEKLTKRFVRKVKDVAVEDVKKNIEDNVQMYSRLAVIGVLVVLVLWPTKKVIPQAAMIVFNTYNYY